MSDERTNETETRREPGVVIERYNVPPQPCIIPQGWAGGGGARRFWVHDRVLVGGSILDLLDGQHLRRDHRIARVLSMENEHMDIGKGFTRAEVCWVPHLDNAQPPHPALYDEALEFATQALIPGAGGLYVHCQLGGSRGPAAGYLVCTGVLGMTKEEALAILKRAHHAGDTPHTAYLKAADEAIARRSAR